MGCANHRSYNLPPAERLMEPGPGVGGPGPGVIPPGSVMGTSMAMPMGPKIAGFVSVAVSCVARLILFLFGFGWVDVTRMPGCLPESSRQPVLFVANHVG